MHKLILVELIKEIKRNSFKFFLILIILSVFLTVYISNKRLNNSYEEYPHIGNEKYDELLTLENQVNSYGDHKLSKVMNNGLILLVFMSVLIIVKSSSILGNELNKKSIKELLTKPYSRKKIILSKILAMYIIIFLMTLFIFTSYTTFLMLITKNNLFKINSLILFNKIYNVPFMLKYLILFIMYSIPMYFLSTFTIFLTIVIKNQKTIVLINIILFILGTVIFSFILNLGFKYIVYTFIPYLDLSIFNDSYNVYLINIEYNINLSMYQGILVLFIYTCIFTLLSIFVFKRKDFN